MLSHQRDKEHSCEKGYTNFVAREPRQINDICCNAKQIAKKVFGVSSRNRYFI